MGIYVINIIAITSFPCGTSFLGALIPKKKNFLNKNISSNCVWGWIAYFAAILEMVTEAKKATG